MFSTSGGGVRLTLTLDRQGKAGQQSQKFPGILILPGGCRPDQIWRCECPTAALRLHHLHSMTPFYSSAHHSKHADRKMSVHVGKGFPAPGVSHTHAVEVRPGQEELKQQLSPASAPIRDRFIKRILQTSSSQNTSESPRSRPFTPSVYQGKCGPYFKIYSSINLEYWREYSI